MMTPTPAFPSRRTSVEYSLEAQMRGDGAGYRGEVDSKWPIWARLVVIVGMSALLWAGIISGVMALFG
ncbi:MAG: hypothetical protein VR74_08815 [Hyphomonas sp. BRH_c22]|nr:MAG: hypothetical protein VR74_08815 [Hyphomonas sp. BRH_c22]